MRSDTASFQDLFVRRTRCTPVAIEKIKKIEGIVFLKARENFGRRRIVKSRMINGVGCAFGESFNVWYNFILVYLYLYWWKWFSAKRKLQRQRNKVRALLPILRKEDIGWGVGFWSYKEYRSFPESILTFPKNSKERSLIRVYFHFCFFPGTPRIPNLKTTFSS